MVPCHHTCHHVFLYALLLARFIPVQVKKLFLVQGGNLSTLATGHSLFRLPLSGTTFLLTSNTAVLSHSSELLLKLFSLFLPTLTWTTLTLSEALDAVLDLILILLLMSSLAGWWFFSVVVMMCVCVFFVVGCCHFVLFCCCCVLLLLGGGGGGWSETRRESGKRGVVRLCVCACGVCECVCVCTCGCRGGGIEWDM